MAPIPRNQRRQLQLQCEWNSCSSVFMSTQSFTEHLMSHAEEFIAGSLSIEKCLADVDENDTDDYQCQWIDCGYVTNEGSAALLRHMLFHGYHTRIKWAGTVERERCKIETCQLEPHSRNIIPEVPSSFVCSWEDCSFVTNNPDYFYCHVEMHSQMEEAERGILSCKWRECQVKTKDKYKLRDHLRCHSQEKRFGCSQCGGLFSNRTKFFDHIHRQGILDEPNYSVHIVPFFKSNWYSLARERKMCVCVVRNFCLQHGIYVWTCVECQVKTKDKYKLRDHLRCHSQEKRFGCSQCGGLFSNRTKFFDHIHRQGILDGNS
eukprot:XP_011664751.1 PREDICTED: histone H4 transcription factor-like [Strongylocentrotus purpuratus]